MKLLMVTLKSIDYVERPDVHTISYAKRVKEWLSQWTVAANYTPIVTALVGDIAQNAIVSAAVDQFVAQHIGWLRSGNVLSELTQEDRDYHNDFRFVYEIYVAESGEPMKYNGRGSR